MIQDIEPYHLDNQYHPVPPDPDSYAMYYEDHTVLLRRTEEGIGFPRFRELERLNDDIYADAVYLFSVNEDRYYLPVLPRPGDKPGTAVGIYDGEYGNIPEGGAAAPGLCRDHRLPALQLV